MPFTKKAFSFFSSSSSDSPNAGGGRRLTRLRKLRHVSDDEVQPFMVDEGSISMPVSPNSYKDSHVPSKSRSCPWSKTAVPQPLPLPHLNSLPKQDAPNPALARDQSSVDMSNAGRSRPSTPTYRRRLFSQDQIAQGIQENFRVNVPTRSAPGSGFASPDRCPNRYSTPDLFRPTFHQTKSADHSPLGSPTYRNSVNKILNHQNGASHSHHKSLPESPVHPLPLPPGFSQQPLSPTSHNNTDKPDVPSVKGQWNKGKLLGRGTYGSVYEATNRETGALCAMKEVDLNPDDPKSAECIKQLEQEIRVLRQLKNPNIVQYYGSETMEDRFCIYLEYVHPGSINKYIKEHCGAMTESIVRSFTRHIVSGLAYLHSTKTIHRDIKGANLLVDAWGTVKLADFGLAKHLSGQATNLSLKGSPHWMAPEVMQAMLREDANPELALAIDIWSLGCTVIEMFTGEPPWSGLDGVKAMFSVLNKSPPVPETLSLDGKDFLRCCFQRKPADRPTALMLLEHPFLNNTCHSVTTSGDISRMTIHSPKDTTSYNKELNLLSSGISSRRAKSLYSSNETCDYGTSSHYLQRLKILPGISSQELNSTSHFMGSLLLGHENRSPNCVFSRTTGKEILNI